MKPYLINSLLICLFLTSCSQTQIPYHLTKSVEKDYKLNFFEIPLGITQEKINENEYRITVKLTEISTRDRANSMALYHAAVLAEEQGYDAFFVSSSMKSNGCSRSTTKYGRAVATKSGRVQVSPTPLHTTSVTGVEPRGGVVITLMDFENTDKRKRKNRRFHLTKTIKDKYKSIIDHIPSKAELEQISEDNFAVCEKVRMGSKRVIR